MALSYRGVKLKNWSLTGSNYTLPDGYPTEYTDSQGRRNVWNSQYGVYETEEVVVLDNKPVTKIVATVPVPDAKKDYTLLYVLGAVGLITIIGIFIYKKR